MERTNPPPMFIRRTSLAIMRWLPTPLRRIDPAFGIPAHPRVAGGDRLVADRPVRGKISLQRPRGGAEEPDTLTNAPAAAVRLDHGRYGDAQRRHFRVRSQHEESVEPRLFGELAHVDLERSPILGPGALAQIAPVSRVADKRLVALLQLGVERGDDRFAILAILLGLRLVAADDIALALDRDLLDKELRLARLAFDEQRDEGIIVFE